MSSLLGNQLWRNIDLPGAQLLSLPELGYLTNWRVTMKNFALKVQRFLASEDGPTAVEYAVMLALIIIVCLGTITTLGTTANDKFQEVVDGMN